MLYADQETFAEPEQLTRRLAHEPGKDLVRDYRPAETEAPLSPTPPPAPEFVRAFAIESSARATPERLAKIDAAMSRLERWDELKIRSQGIARSRQALPHHGSLPDLKQTIADLERPPWHFEHDLGRIYRDPQSAGQALEQHARRTTQADAFRCLAETPGSFGRARDRDSRDDSMAVGVLERPAERVELSVALDAERSLPPCHALGLRPPAARPTEDASATHWVQ